MTATRPGVPEPNPAALDSPAAIPVISLSSSLSRRGGGLFDAARRLCQATAPLGVEIEAVGLNDEFAKQDAPRWGTVATRLFQKSGPSSIGYAPHLTGALLASDAALVHQHGLWMYPSVACSKWARRTGKPYMISPHGMLDPWALGNSPWKKRLAGWAFQNAHLRDAACLHALSESEAASIRAYGLSSPICVIPNGVDLPEVHSGQPPPWGRAVDKSRKVLLFLGRIHPKKGLQPLLRAWAEASERSGASADDWALAVAGWDQGGHEGELKRQARELGLKHSVHFVGPLFDEYKAAALEHADAFVLPSFSEGLPMAMLEAWAYGLPVLMTPHCNIPEGYSTAAALSVEPQVESIARGLSTLWQMSDAERRNMGARGRALVTERFAWPQVAERMKSVYAWVLGWGERPECVRLDSRG